MSNFRPIDRQTGFLLPPSVDEKHHPPLAERFAMTPQAPHNPTPVEAMAHRLRGQVLK